MTLDQKFMVGAIIFLLCVLANKVNKTEKIGVVQDINIENGEKVIRDFSGKKVVVNVRGGQIYTDKGEWIGEVVK